MNKNQVSSVIEKLKELVAKGNVSRIIVCRKGEELINIPVTVGIVGGVAGIAASKWLMLAAVLATVGFGCTVDIVKSNDEVVSVLNEESGDKMRSAVSQTVSSVVDTVKNGIDIEVTIEKDKPAEDDIPEPDIYPEEENKD